MSVQAWAKIVLATLFLLSYAKLFNTIISVISYTTLYTTQGKRLVWSVDGNVDYLGPKHAPLFVVALIVLIFMWLPYTLILLLGKWLHKINIYLIARFPPGVSSMGTIIAATFPCII